MLTYLTDGSLRLQHGGPRVFEEAKRLVQTLHNPLRHRVQLHTLPQQLLKLPQLRPELPPKRRSFSGRLQNVLLHRHKRRRCLLHLRHTQNIRFWMHMGGVRTGIGSTHTARSLSSAVGRDSIVCVRAAASGPCLYSSMLTCKGRWWWRRRHCPRNQIATTINHILAEESSAPTAAPAAPPPHPQAP